MNFLIGLYVGGCIGYGLRTFVGLFYSMAKLHKEQQFNKSILVIALMSETAPRIVLWPYYLIKDLIGIIPTKQ